MWVSFVMYLLVSVHIVIWLYVLLGGLLFPQHIPFILLCLLPVIYVVQSMPCHFIVYSKLKFIEKHRDHMHSLGSYVFNVDDVSAIEQIHVTCGIDKNQLIDSWRVMKYYEHKLILPEMVDRMRIWFDQRSYINPLSPQGMLTLSFICNCFAYAFHARRNTIKVPRVRK